MTGPREPAPRGPCRTPKSRSSASSRPSMSHCSSTLSGGTYCDHAVADDLGAHVPMTLADVARFHELGALLVDRPCAGRSRRRRIRAGSCGCRSCAPRPCAARARSGATSMPLSMTSSSFMPTVLQQALDPLRVAEDAHQVVFERQVEAARAGIALAAGTAAQLVVDAPRLVALGADDVQAARPRSPSS